MNLYLDNSNVIELRDLKNSVTGDADTGATVAVTITDSSGNEVGGATWPISMTHVADGKYRATLSPDVALLSDSLYLVVVEATGSGGEKGEWNCDLIAADRGCS